MESSLATTGPEGDAPTEADAFVRKQANADEFRASLAAVRAAQSAADARARHATYRTRFLVVAVMAAVGLMGWNRAARRSHQAPRTVAASAVASPITAAPVAATAILAPATAADPVIRVPPAEPAPVVPAAIDTAASLEAAKQCDSAFAAHHWPSVATACAVAFKLHPHDSALCMRVAQAEHRRGFLADAGEWADRAIALDPGIPEAFVIQAHAATLAGDTGAAAAAYRRYLTLAPRGWHAAEARQALRQWNRRLSRND